MVVPWQRRGGSAKDGGHPQRKKPSSIRTRSTIVTMPSSPPGTYPHSWQRMLALESPISWPTPVALCTDACRDRVNYQLHRREQRRACVHDLQSVRGASLDLAVLALSLANSMQAACFPHLPPRHHRRAAAVDSAHPAGRRASLHARLPTGLPSPKAPPGASEHDSSVPLKHSDSDAAEIPPDLLHPIPKVCVNAFPVENATRSVSVRTFSAMASTSWRVRAASCAGSGAGLV